MSYNRNAQKFGMDAVQRRLQGQRDPRSLIALLMRGRNIYKGTTNSAQLGGGSQFGRPVGSGDVSPVKSAINRRMAKKNGRMMPYG